MVYTARVRMALRFAERHHRGRRRKGTDAPFVLHPVAVTALLAAAGASDDILCAGYLHDVVEDEDVTLTEIESCFGEHVADLVAAVTEEKRDANGEPRPWRTRKEETLERLASASNEVLLLKGADVCSNIADLVFDHAEHGDAVWERFRAGQAEQAWYYATVAETVLGRLAGYEPLRQELAQRLAELRAIATAAVNRP
jgi:(p)ppGpp synthase/HD superfamily hydrolase